MSEERELYIANDWNSMNQILGRISDRLDQISGLRGRPTFFTDIWEIISDSELSGTFFPGTTTNVNQTTNINQTVTPITFRPIETTDLEQLDPNLLVRTDGDGFQLSVDDLTDWIAGTTNRVSVTDDGDGTVTLSTPQDTHIGASPTFDSLTLTGDIAVTGEASIGGDAEIPNLRYNAKLYYMANF